MQQAALKMAAEYAIGNESLEWLILFFMVKFRLACQMPCLNFLEQAWQLIITTEFGSIRLCIRRYTSKTCF